MIKNYFILVMTIVVMSASITAQADKKQKVLPVLDRLDHNANTIVVDDRLYSLPLNVKVYKVKVDGSQKRVVNRYALKQGQNVSVNSRQSGKKTYADTIFILE